MTTTVPPLDDLLVALRKLLRSTTGYPAGPWRDEVVRWLALHDHAESVNNPARGGWAELDLEALERAARKHRGNGRGLLPAWELLSPQARSEWRESARRVIEAYLGAPE